MATIRLFNPVPLKLIPTGDPTALLAPSHLATALPLSPHPGAFGTVHHQRAHEGVDLYCHEGTEVSAIEDGLVVAVPPFRGPHAGTPWWLNTWAVLVEGVSGVLVYGHVQPVVVSGEAVKAGQHLGQVLRVLRENKGKPTSMLHIERYTAGTRQFSVWTPPHQRPAQLRDPTALLLQVANGG